MAASERKEVVGLNTFYHVPEDMAEPLRIEIDDFSRYLIEKGDSEALNLFDDKVKASLGQRYVMVAFIKDGVVHLHAIPGFEFVADEKERERLREKAVKFFDSKEFKCTGEDIAFPDHAIWTGVVHEQLIKNTIDQYPDLEDAHIVAFSMFKRDGKFSWLNRSARNVDVFNPDPLATACYMFVERSSYADFKAPPFDLFYHLTRAIPKVFFEDLTNLATEEICREDYAPLAKTSLGECNNFSYEASWERMRKLFITDRDKACADIQHMLMRNLHVYLSGKSAEHDRERAEDILIRGLEAAEQHGIYINLNYIPAEFKDDANALEKVKSFGSDRLRGFLGLYNDRKHIRYLSADLRAGKHDHAKEMLLDTVNSKPEKWKRYLHGLSGQAYDFHPETINLLFEICTTPEMKAAVCNELISRFSHGVKAGWLDQAIEFIHALSEDNYYYFVEKLQQAEDVPLSVLNQCARIFRKDKPDFNEQDTEGDTLLHIIVKQDYELPDLLRELLSTTADHNIENNQGKTALDIAMERNLYEETRILLDYGATLPDYFAEDSAQALKLQDFIKKMIKYKLDQDDDKKILNVISAMIADDINEKIKTKLVNIILSLFYADNTAEYLIKFLRLRDIPQEYLSQTNISSSAENFLELVTRIADKDTKLALIHAALDEKSSIGLALLKSTEAKINFRQKLIDLEVNIEIDSALCSFEDKTYEGEFFDAKYCLKRVDKEKIIFAINKKYEGNFLLKTIALQLLEEKPDFNKTSTNGDTLLHLAVKLKDGENIVSELLGQSRSRKPNPNIYDQYYHAPLFYALQDKNWVNVRNLIHEGADPNDFIDIKDCPLIRALEAKAYSVAIIMMREKARFHDDFAFDSEHSRMITSRLEELFNKSIKEASKSDNEEIFVTLSLLVYNQKNKPIQNKLVDIELKIFNTCLINGDLIAVNRFFNNVHFPFEISLSVAQQVEAFSNLNNFLKNMTDIKAKLNIINTLLDRTCIWAEKLLHDNSWTSLYTQSGDIFRKNLEKMKKNLESEVSQKEKLEFKYKM